MQASAEANAHQVRPQAIEHYRTCSKRPNNNIYEQSIFLYAIYLRKMLVKALTRLYVSITYFFSL